MFPLLPGSYGLTSDWICQAIHAALGQKEPELPQAVEAVSTVISVQRYFAEDKNHFSV